MEPSRTTPDKVGRDPEPQGPFPSFVFFGDEQDTTDSMLFGGILIRRQTLKALDDGVTAAKVAVGLDPYDPVKPSPPRKPVYAAQRSLPPKSGVPVTR